MKVKLKDAIPTAVTPASRQQTLLNLTPGGDLPIHVGEFWSARQRGAHNLHEVSYRACFKPQLPRYFIERYTAAGDTVLDPFMGRGTTLIEAALLGRIPLGVDINPLCRQLVRPRLSPPENEAVATRLTQIPFAEGTAGPEDLLTFYHPETLREICGLREYLAAREQTQAFDEIDDWIRMVAMSRLTGHSPGFFSVYTLPPNQAVSLASQRKINARLKQVPERRDVAALIQRKSRALLKDCSALDRKRLKAAAQHGGMWAAAASQMNFIPAGSVRLVVTSPPFLDTVNYAADNWLRAWFAGVDVAAVPLSIFKDVGEWTDYMTLALRECHRVLVRGGQVAFEVGEVRGATVKLEDYVLIAGQRANFEAVECLINAQNFTKTANCWGVTNGIKGTNSNRIILFRKP